MKAPALKAPVKVVLETMPRQQPRLPKLLRFFWPVGAYFYFMFTNCSETGH
jgi:hypothetical protein